VEWRPVTRDSRHRADVSGHSCEARLLYCWPEAEAELAEAFDLEGDTITIIAAFRGARDPKNWQNRV